MRYDDNRPKLIRWAIYSAIMLGAVVLQNSVGGLTEIFGARILLAIPFCVSVGMQERELPAAIISAFAGVLWDISCGADGFNAITLMLVGGACSLLISHFMRNNVITALVLCAGATAVYQLIYMIVNLWGKGVSVGYLFTFYLPSLLLTVLVMPLCYDLIKAVFKNFKTTE